MKRDKLVITLKDETDKVREKNEILEMLIEIGSIAERHGYRIPHVDVGLTVVLPGRIQNARIDFAFS